MQPSALAIINYNAIQPATFFKHCPQAKVWRFATQSKFCLTLSRLKYACFHANPVQTSRKFRTVRYGVYFRKSSTPIHRVNVFCIKTTIISASAIVRMLFSVIVHNVYRIRSSLMCTLRNVLLEVGPIHNSRIIAKPTFPSAIKNPQYNGK